MEPVQAWVYTSPSDVWHADSFGYLASALVSITFSKQPMRALRLFAVASNAPSSAAIQLESAAHAVLQGMLLPTNIVQLARLNLNGGEARRFTSVQSGTLGA